MRRGSINPEGMFCYIDLLSCFKVKDSFVTKLSNKLSNETKKEVRDRMIDGGNSPEYIKF